MWRAREAADAAFARHAQALPQGRRKRIRGLARPEAGALLPIGEPESRGARVPGLDQAAGRLVARPQPLQQELDAAPAGQSHVGGPANPISQALAQPVRHHLLGVQRDVGLDASSGQVAGHIRGPEQHLGPEAARGAAFSSDERGHDGGLAGLDQGLEQRPDIVLQAEFGPVDVGQVHARRLDQRAAGRVFR